MKNKLLKSALFAPLLLGMGAASAVTIQVDAFIDGSDELIYSGDGVLQ